MPLGGCWRQVERGTAAGETGAAAALLPHGTVRRKRAGQPLDKPSHARGQANFLQLVSKTGAGFCHPQNVSLQQELRLRGRKHVEGAAVPRALRGRALGGRGPLRERERREVFEQFMQARQVREHAASELKMHSDALQESQVKLQDNLFLL